MGLFEKPEEPTTESRGIVLGEKIENPFSLSRVRSLVPDAEINLYYIRLKTEDADLMARIEENYEYVSLYPLDYEIIEGGTSYYDSEIEEEGFNWIYMFVTVEEYYELFNENVIIEILDEMYYTEELMEQIEAEYDALTRSSRVNRKSNVYEHYNRTI
jgi:hypothetical protein